MGDWCLEHLGTHLSPSGLWAEEEAVMAMSALLDESCRGIWGVCKAIGVCWGVCVPSLLHVTRDPPCRPELRGESACSPLALIPGRFPSSRKHKPPSSIIHQVLNLSRSHPTPWPCPPPSAPLGKSRVRVSRGAGAGNASGFLGLGVADPFGEGKFNKDSGVSASPSHK